MELTINGSKCNSIDDVFKVASVKVAEFIAEYINDKPYVIAHTSGSTGKPKDINLLKSDMKASAQLTNDYFGLTNESVFYLNLSPDYIAGKMMIVRAFELGAKIIEESPSNQPLANYNSNERIGFGAFVPSQIKYLINNPEKLLLFDNIIIGGGALPSRLERWLAEQGIKAYRTYGMTETCSHVALAPVGSVQQPFSALGDISFSLDERGCLIVNAPHFSTTKIITNDVVELLSSTQFKWCGRIDNVINTGGIKVFPEDIEPQIAELLPNCRFFITSQPSDKWGEELILAIEYSGLSQNEVKKGDINPALLDKLKIKLPSYAVPRKYIAVKQSKETYNGKIVRELPI